MSLYKLKGTSGTVINQSFPLGNSFVLGSSSDCQVQIEEPGIAAHHAEITLVDDQTLVLKDLGSSTGTLLNGERVKEAMLSSGDEIHIGSCRWMVQAPGLRPDRVLTSDAVKPARRWPKALAWTALLLTAATLAVVQLKPEWLDFVRSLFE